MDYKLIAKEEKYNSQRCCSKFIPMIIQLSEELCCCCNELDIKFIDHQGHTKLDIILDNLVSYRILYWVGSQSAQITRHDLETDELETTIEAAYRSDPEKDLICVIRDAIDQDYIAYRRQKGIGE